MARINSQLFENADSYMLKAEIPKHEAENISVKVEKDRIVISGQRQFQDEVKDANKRISTNNFQSLFEERKLDRQVDEKSISRSYD
ncbi:Hsp20/alpha crystallin family protein, partial [Streptomyces caeruleatus]